MEKNQSDDVSIGKFDILATYAYAHALLSGMDDDEAKLGCQDYGRAVRGPGK